MCDKQKIINLRNSLIDGIWTYEKDSLFHLIDNEEITDSIYYDKLGHYLSLSIDMPGQISYATKPEYKFDYKRRTRTTLGRYLSRNYNLEITPEIQNAIDKLMASFCYSPDSFEIREDVRAIYNEVASSCMTDMDCVKFYENNGVKVVVYRKNGAKIGRALLWNTDQGEYLDRVYPNSGPHIALYQRWAEERGCNYRTKHSQGEINEEFTISNIKVGPLPYLDTFCFLRGNQLSSRDNGGFICHSTDGVEPCNCDNCGELCLPEYEVDGNNVVCESCYDEFDCCERCDCRFSNLEEVGGQYVCPSCARDANECDKCQENFFGTVYTVGDKEVCYSCYANTNRCECCQELTFEDLEEVNNKDCCPNCVEVHQDIVTLTGETTTNVQS